MLHHIYNHMSGNLLRQKARVITCNTWLCHRASECVQIHHRNSTSARWHVHSPGPHVQPCRSCSSTAPSPSLAPCSPWKCDHSCDSCSTLKTGNTGHEQKLTKRVGHYRQSGLPLMLLPATLLCNKYNVLMIKKKILIVQWKGSTHHPQSVHSPWQCDLVPRICSRTDLKKVKRKCVSYMLTCKLQ